jgi:hypothetical protein
VGSFCKYGLGLWRGVGFCGAVWRVGDAEQQAIEEAKGARFWVRISGLRIAARCCANGTLRAQQIGEKVGFSRENGDKFFNFVRGGRCARGGPVWILARTCGRHRRDPFE